MEHPLNQLRYQNLLTFKYAFKLFTSSLTITQIGGTCGAF